MLFMFLVSACVGGVLCNETHRFQYVCDDDADDIPGMRTCPTDKPYAWNTTHIIEINCHVYDGVDCEGPRYFTQERPCFLTFVFHLILLCVYSHMDELVQ